MNVSHYTEPKSSLLACFAPKQFSQRALRRLSSLVLALTLSYSASTFAETDNNEVTTSTTAIRVQALDVFKLRQATETIFAAGQPEPEHIPKLAKAGIKHVINLRASGEVSWDEALAVSQNGMSYHSLPIAGAKDITFENAAKLDALLNDTKEENVLLHCGSSNRVGALIALQSFKDTNDPEAAIDKGKSYGLTGLEPVVRKLIKENKVK